MAFRATNVSSDPLGYFLQVSDEGPHLRVSDVLLRSNQDATEVFSQLIRFVTSSQWSHSALLYLLSDPPQGFDNTFIVEAMTTGIRVASWRNELVPFEKFRVGIRRLPLDWYAETPQEQHQHNQDDPEDVHGITYLRHVRGMAIDQINGLYSHDVINELTALYIERISKQYSLHLLEEIATQFVRLFEKWDETPDATQSVMRFICSGLVQYSYFAALRLRIMIALANGAQDAAMSNLENMERIVFRPDPEGIMKDYIQQVKAGKLKISDDIPTHVMNFLRTTTPADFNNSPNLEWRYIILKGLVWKIDQAPDSYVPQSDAEKQVLILTAPEHRSQNITGQVESVSTSSDASS